MGESRLQGIPASPGIVIGPVFIYYPVDLTIPERSCEGAEAELKRFNDAIEVAEAELHEIRDLVIQKTGNEEEAAIFDAHSLMLADPMLAEAVGTRINEGWIVEKAVAISTEEIAEMLATMEDEYFAARATDVRDVGNRLLRILLGIADTSLASLDHPAIIVAQDLTPSDTARLNPDHVVGICTAVGGLTSHTAILARTLGIPAVVGLGQDLNERVAGCTELILDGIQGIVIVDPQQAIREGYREEIIKRETWLRNIRAGVLDDAYTASGTRIEIGANIGDIDSAQLAVSVGAEGVGLLRTEFLYLGDTQPPGEEKQFQAYREIFETLAPRPIVVRTLDVGGDKPPSYMKFPQELNPFLGWRAIRIGLDDEALLKTQLKAIARAASGYEVLIMFPMISRVEELDRAKELFHQVVAELEQSGVAYSGDIPIGVMIETPAAAMIADYLAERCDFFSIGTNDLTQYALAVDRTNERVADIYQPLHPAVLRLIKNTIDAGHNAGIWVGMCGELAGMLAAIPILVGFGLDEFSMAPNSIPEAKWLIRRLSDERASQIASDVLSLRTASEIENYMQPILESEFTG
jgi:phosphotransferase system enzyme I (PtsI)